MATANSNSSLDHLTSVYKNVIDDVIRNVREEFLNEAVDLEVLEDLKRIWLNKLSLSGAVNRPSKPDPPPKSVSSDPKPSPRQTAQTSMPKSTNHSLPPPLVPVQQERPLPQPPSLISSRNTERESSSVIHTAPPRSQTTPTIVSTSSLTQPQASIVVHPGMMTAVGEGGSTATSQPMPALLQPSFSAFQQGMVPIQTAQGTVLVPLSHLMAFQKQAAAAAQGSKSKTQEKDVQQIDGYSPLPARYDFSDLQAVSKQDKQVTVSRLPTCLEIKGTKQSGLSATEDILTRQTKRSCFPKPGDTVEFEVIEQLDGLRSDHKSNCSSRKKRGFIAQLDGGDSSSEEDSDLDDDSSEEDVGGTDEAVDDEDPLNSDDDVDDDVGDQKDFETNDTIVCLWEKVYRVRTKWKFLLKDGIMHLGGYDYVFQKGTGEADW